VLAGLGPNWAVWIAAPQKDSWVPEFTAVLRVTDAGDGSTTRAVAQAVDAAAQLLRVDHNRKHSDPIDLVEETRDGVTVKYLTSEKALPTGFRPAYAIRDGYLVLAGSPDAVRRFKAPSSSAAGGSPSLWISAARLGEYLGRHKRAVAEVVAKGSNRPLADVEKEFADLAAALEAFDRIEVTHSAVGGKVKLALRVEFVKPLK
jgi:hypothetical protein